LARLSGLLVAIVNWSGAGDRKLKADRTCLLLAEKFNGYCSAFRIRYEHLFNYYFE
jgi:hypothetical protein